MNISLFLVCTIAAIWILVLAIASVQNATLVSLTFLFWESIRMPVGVLLAASFAVGLLGGTLYFGKR
ncbi:MAG TPA: DUF1049 domain-containing protein [Oscillatoriales cyanobacterium M59_W2019_021]|nr:MAG: LapA family protein [Cyanobacteria bacterium J055]HIK31089.1 DUF1049 domain-containing protein [Oscillatoriales cyanobacterium M4454_W2019_049]HIK52446.1 DUF1049 domain-containing protein [Oscillatoriales cyanobacterium M59_W2019_021]